VGGGRTDGVKVRIAIGLGGSAIDAAELTSIVTSLSALHFDSLWISEVLTGPAPDPLITLATAAQLNPKIKLGTTMLLPGRNELRLAKSLASLDVLSRGRLLVTFVPGLAHGPERDAIGVPVSERGAAIERTIPRLRRWWAGDAVDGVTIAPRPIQTPLEVWLGGLAPASLVRCGAIADGWLGASCTPAEASLARVAIEAAATAADRLVDPEHFGMSIGYSHQLLDDRQLASLAARTRGRDVDPRALVPVGVDEVRKALQHFIDVGISKFVLRPIAAPPDWSDELAELAAGVADLQT
jgi:probable F420-dependent oxidoreductase